MDGRIELVFVIDLDRHLEAGLDVDCLPHHGISSLSKHLIKFIFTYVRVVEGPSKLMRIWIHRIYVILIGLLLTVLLVYKQG